MLTEKEAVGKWCPMARVVFDQRDTPVWNRDDNVPQLCCASRCMAWRWITEAERRSVHHNSPEFNTVNRVDTFELDGKWWRYEFTSSGPHGKFDQIYRVDAHAAKRGYCGAFGKPEEG